MTPALTKPCLQEGYQDIPQHPVLLIKVLEVELSLLSFILTSPWLLLHKGWKM